MLINIKLLLIDVMHHWVVMDYLTHNLLLEPVLDSAQVNLDLENLP
jgi:hypothetical protein